MDILYIFLTYINISQDLGIWIGFVSVLWLQFLPNGFFLGDTRPEKKNHAELLREALGIGRPEEFFQGYFDIQLSLLQLVTKEIFRRLKSQAFVFF